MSRVYSEQRYVEDLRRIARESNDEEQNFAHAGPLARREDESTGRLQQEHDEAGVQQGSGGHLLHDDSYHSPAVIIVSWLPGCGTPRHDHGQWSRACNA